MSRPPDILATLAIHAAERPRHPAFQIVGDRGAIVLDYAGLQARVQRLGTGLASAVEAGDRIAICMENRPAWPVAYLSTWYANAVTVPIDPALEAHAIRRILEHSGARLCLTSDALAARVAAAADALDHAPRLYNVDASGNRHWDGEVAGEGVPTPQRSGIGAPWEAISAGAPRAWAPLPATAEAGTIMYTSGTTGNPKGVMLSRGALMANIESGLSRIHVTESDHVLGILPLFHALPLMGNCLGPVYKGARVTFLSELNPDRIIAAFKTYSITAFACVPLFYYRFHDRVMKRLAALPPLRRRVARLLLRVSRLARRTLGWNLGRRFFAAAHEPFGTGLRLFVTGGAKFDTGAYEDFLDLGFTLVQGYGLTEASAVLTAHRRDGMRGDTVGPPVDGVEIRIRQPNEDGVGEILARTPSRMLGYYRNPEATAEVFEGEWLRTGDLGRLRADGQLQVTGRAKDMIVLASGKNIYPEELEAFYGQSALVAEICILGIDDPERQGAERLHAVVVPDLDVARERGQVNIREMVKWELEGLGLQLPGPQRVTSLELRTDPLPRTTTRKVKRFELKREILERGPAPDRGEVVAPRVAERGAAPVDEPGWAHEVRALVAHHARTESVHRAQHLDLDLGLESLDRVELQAAIEEAFRVQLPRESAGAVQTVGDLIDFVGEHLAEGASASTASSDRWQLVLAEAPPDIEPYLRSRPLGEFLVRVVFALARGLLRVRGLRIRGLENLPANAPFIIAPNHFSYVDPFLLALSLPRAVFSRVFFVGYSAYFDGPVTGRLARLLRTVPIDQNRHLERAMQAAAEGLRREMVLGIFPEGGRSNDGTVKEFRRGTGILARHLRVPVVPVGMWGTYEMWPRDGRLRPHPLALVFGEPMTLPEDATRQDEEELMTRLRDRVIELVAEARSLYGQKK